MICKCGYQFVYDTEVETVCYWCDGTKPKGWRKIK